MIPMPHTVTVVSPTTSTDRYNNVARSYSPGTRRTMRGFLQPMTTPENTVDRSAVTYGYVLFSIEAVDAHDRVEFEGRTYEVDGPSRHWTALTGSHYETFLRVTEG